MFDQFVCLSGLSACFQKRRFCLFWGMHWLPGWASFSFWHLSQFGWPPRLSACSQKTRFCVFEACVRLQLDFFAFCFDPGSSQAWAHALEKQNFVSLRHALGLEVARFAFYDSNFDLDSSQTQVHVPKRQDFVFLEHVLGLEVAQIDLTWLQLDLGSRTSPRLGLIFLT